jgi:hypothetical protein
MGRNGGRNGNKLDGLHRRRRILLITVLGLILKRSAASCHDAPATTTSVGRRCESSHQIAKAKAFFAWLSIN